MANHRKMVFYTKELRDLVDRLKEIGYEVDPSLVIDPADFDNSMKDVVVIILDKVSLCLKQSTILPIMN